MKEKELIKWYMGQQKWTEEQYKENENRFEDFDDFPTKSNGCCSKIALRNADVDYDLE